jgi:hypothetical protein
MARKRHVPPLLRDEAEVRKDQSNRRRPKKQEKKVARAIGGKRQPGSGSNQWAKGDVLRDGPPQDLDRTFSMLVECKRSMGKKSIRVEADWLTKITNEALPQGKYPALALQFDEEVMRACARGRGGVPAPEDWIAVPLMAFRAMLEDLDVEDGP